MPVVSTKSFFGHCMGVTGILEATCQLLAMNAGFIPPTLNFTEARPGCTLDYVPNEARPADYPAFLSANYAFGGNNAAVVVTRWDHPTPPRPRRAGRVVDHRPRDGHRGRAGDGPPAGGVAGRTGLPGAGDPVPPAGADPLPAGGAWCEPFRESAVDRRLDFSSLNDISRYAVSAAKLALDDARLRVGQANADRIGVAMGVCNGTAGDGPHGQRLRQRHVRRPASPASRTSSANSTAGWVSASL